MEHGSEAEARVRNCAAPGITISTTWRRPPHRGRSGMIFSDLVDGNLERQKTVVRQSHLLTLHTPHARMEVLHAGLAIIGKETGKDGGRIYGLFLAPKSAPLSGAVHHCLCREFGAACARRNLPELSTLGYGIQPRDHQLQSYNHRPLVRIVEGQ